MSGENVTFQLDQQWLCEFSIFAVSRSTQLFVHLTKGTTSFFSLCPFHMTSANSAKRLSCSKIKTLTVAPFHLMAMLKLSPIKCWSDTTLENVPTNDATALAAALSHCHPRYRLNLITMEIGFSDISWLCFESHPWGCHSCSVSFSSIFPSACSLNGSVVWIIFLVWRRRGVNRCCTSSRGERYMGFYRSRSGFRDLSSVFLPLRAGVMAFHVRSLEGLLDIRQSESTNCRRLYVFPRQHHTHTHRVRKRPEHRLGTLTAINPDLL